MKREWGGRSAKCGGPTADSSSRMYLVGLVEAPVIYLCKRRFTRAEWKLLHFDSSRPVVVGKREKKKKKKKGKRRERGEK